MRRLARESVFLLVFEYTFYKTPNETTLELMTVGSELTDDDKQYIKDCYYGVIAEEDELRDRLTKCLTGYSLDRIYRPDYVALLVATYGMTHHNAPLAVEINEAVDLAKKFGTEKSGKFVNGVLAKVAESLSAGA